jgi:hypothetical protein
MESLDLNVTVDRPMPDAQTQILDSVDFRLRSVGFTGHPGHFPRHRQPARPG